jgi:hypothetical protein
MTTQPDPADGPLVEREGVNADSDASTAEDAATVASAESARGGGPATGRPAGPDTTPSQVWAGDSGVADPEAPYGSESGQDAGSNA